MKTAKEIKQAHRMLTDMVTQGSPVRVCMPGELEERMAIILHTLAWCINHPDGQHLQDMLDGLRMLATIPKDTGHHVIGVLIPKKPNEKSNPNRN